MKFEFSAGGIVYKPVRQLPPEADRQGKKNLKILICQHSQHHGWVFPKGLIDKKEAKEETAVREVKEETGIDAEIEKALTPSEYWYQWEGDPSTGSGQEKVKKTVYFFIMKFVGGDTKNHDFEMEKVEWIDYNDVSQRLTYPSDKKAWEAARRAISRQPAVGHRKDDRLKAKTK